MSDGLLTSNNWFQICSTIHYFFTCQNYWSIMVAAHQSLSFQWVSRTDLHLCPRLKRYWKCFPLIGKDEKEEVRLQDIHQRHALKKHQRTLEWLTSVTHQVFLQRWDWPSKSTQAIFISHNTVQFDNWKIQIDEMSGQHVPKRTKTENIHRKIKVDRRKSVFSLKSELKSNLALTISKSTLRRSHWQIDLMKSLEWRWGGACPIRYSSHWNRTDNYPGKDLFFVLASIILTCEKIMDCRTYLKSIAWSQETVWGILEMMFFHVMKVRTQQQILSHQIRSMKVFLIDDWIIFTVSGDVVRLPISHLFCPDRAARRLNKAIILHQRWSTCSYRNVSMPFKVFLFEFSIKKRSFVKIRIIFKNFNNLNL